VTTPAGENPLERVEAEAEEIVPEKFLADLRDAVSTRTVVLVVGVLVLQLGFILSYVGAFHAPRPVRIPIGVVAPTAVAAKATAELNGIASHPLQARVVASEPTALRDLHRADLSAALVMSPTSQTDTLLVASGGGASVVTAVETVITDAESTQHRHLRVVDEVPLQAGDGRGLTGFYLVIGWIVGGYLVAALLGVSAGARPETRRRAAIRLLASVPYAVVSGLGGAVIVGPVLGALTGHLVALWWIGALLVFCSSAVTMALQALFGVIGIGITVLFFVVLGNPSAGGAYQAALLPPFWRALSGALPNGAGVDAVRRVAYFGANGIGGDLLVLALYAVAGVVVTMLGSYRRQRRATAPSLTA
jgi:hypothetical protein